MENIYVNIKKNDDIGEVDLKALQEIFKKDIVSVRQLIDELLDYNDQLIQIKSKDDTDFGQNYDEDEIFMKNNNIQ